MEKCEIIVTTRSGQEIVGTVTLEGRQLTIEPKSGYETFFKRLLDERHYINDDMVSAREDSRSWFKTLPSHFSGAFVRARIV